jgi:sterol desaturase/sphingolipid hydroxylase (fatty acid hydroxylase superfamily)
MGRATEHNKHSMVSDWHLADKSTWNFYQRFIDRAQIYPIWPDKAPPVFAMTDKVPYMSSLSQHIFIIFFLAIPLLLHQAYASYTGHNIGKVAAFFLYQTAYVLIAVREVRMLRRLIYRYGNLDGAHARDGIPNTGAGKIVGEMHKTAGFRLAMAVMVTYNTSITPLDAMSDPKWWGLMLAKLSLYGVTLDFFFYSYHRACHELPGLWKYHRTHHLAKHPTAVHSGFADDEQEIIEIIIVPILTFATLWCIGLPMDFYDWWICFQYVTYSEVFGHSGLRVHGNVPSPVQWVWPLFNADLALEDHDLHHRKGWKKSFNYGKQTRVWDRLFGTCGDRIEAQAHNIDYDTMVWMPMF